MAKVAIRPHQPVPLCWYCNLATCFVSSHCTAIIVDVAAADAAAAPAADMTAFCFHLRLRLVWFWSLPSAGGPHSPMHHPVHVSKFVQVKCRRAIVMSVIINENGRCPVERAQEQEQNQELEQEHTEKKKHLKGLATYFYPFLIINI